MGRDIPYLLQRDGIDARGCDGALCRYGVEHVGRDPLGRDAIWMVLPQGGGNISDPSVPQMAVAHYGAIEFARAATGQRADPGKHTA